MMEVLNGKDVGILGRNLDEEKKRSLIFDIVILRFQKFKVLIN